MDSLPGARIYFTGCPQPDVYIYVRMQRMKRMVPQRMRWKYRHGRLTTESRRRCAEQPIIAAQETWGKGDEQISRQM